MAALFIGDHLAADFLNTRTGVGDQVREFIGDGMAFVDWLAEAGAVAPDEAARVRSRFSVEQLDRAAQQAREMREWARACVERWAAGKKIDDDLVHLQEMLDLCRYRRMISVAGEAENGLQWVPELESPDALLGLLAGGIAELLTKETPSSFKRCIGHGCSLSFMDRTKSQRRLYCSAALCGNRAKVAAFRARHGQAAGEGKE